MPDISQPHNVGYFGGTADVPGQGEMTVVMKRVDVPASRLQ